VSDRDRDHRPTRRRDFADDDYQPPSRNFGYAPPRGPQFESPSGPPVRAFVKWFNPDKGFGFVTLDDGSGADAFLHASVVERSGHASMPPGATLEVRTGQGSKGQQVSEVLSVDLSTAGKEQPRRPKPERPAYRPSADRATIEELGTVKWYNATKGFGFVAPDRGGRDVFVHVTALQRSGILGLPGGQRVAVDVADGERGPEAMSLRLI
jgi:CspA family cold shock protein